MENESNEHDVEDAAEATACAYCGTFIVGEVQDFIHRDGVGVGPEVALCSTCASGEEPTREAVRARIAWKRWTARGTIEHRVPPSKQRAAATEKKTFVVFAQTREGALRAFARAPEPIDEASVAEATDSPFATEDSLCDNRLAPGAF